MASLRSWNHPDHSYVASMQRKCRNEACATHPLNDALDQLHEGDILAIPFTPHMAYGDIFIGQASSTTSQC